MYILNIVFKRFKNNVRHCAIIVIFNGCPWIEKVVTIIFMEKRSYVMFIKPYDSWARFYSRFQIRCAFFPTKGSESYHVLSNDTLCCLYEVVYPVIQFQLVFRHFGLTIWPYFLVVLMITFKNGVRHKWSWSNCIQSKYWI